MALAKNATAAPQADKPDSTVIAVTSDGRVFVGAEPVELKSLAALSDGTVYLKADARVEYQKLLAVLDVLHGREIVLLTAPANSGQKTGTVPPYGIKLAVGQ